MCAKKLDITLQKSFIRYISIFIDIFSNMQHYNFYLNFNEETVNYLIQITNSPRRDVTSQQEYFREENKDAN